MFRKGTQFLGTLSVALTVILASAGTLASQVTDNVTATPHNFSGTRLDGTFGDITDDVQDYGEVCVYCHTPHGGSMTAPLWNRTDPSMVGYQMYNAASNTGQADINMSFESAPSGVSLACLSCHDGTIGIDVITNVPNTFDIATNPANNVTIGNIPEAASALLDTDLRNDHPISMIYDNTQDIMFNDVGSVTSSTVTATTGGLRLFAENRVQCASCHNPHTTRPTFLRKSNADSGLCRTCHIK